jgi:hypothetical protein
MKLIQLKLTAENESYVTLIVSRKATEIWTILVSRVFLTAFCERVQGPLTLEIVKITTIMPYYVNVVLFYTVKIKLLSCMCVGGDVPHVFLNDYNMTVNFFEKNCDKNLTFSLLNRALFRSQYSFKNTDINWKHMYVQSLIEILICYKTENKVHVFLSPFHFVLWYLYLCHALCLLNF